MNKPNKEDIVWTLKQGIGALAGAYIALWLFLAPRESHKLIEDFTPDVALAWCVFGVVLLFSLPTPNE